MDHEFGPQLAGTCSHSIAGGATGRELAPQFFHQGGTSGIVDGTVNPTSTGQALVGGVDDGVHILMGDVAFHQFKNGAAK
jgi:hypothetical protein